MIEYDQGLVKEKSSLEGFANKYVIEGIFGLTPIQYFDRIEKTLIDFFTYHENIKFRLVLVCIMEKQHYDKKIGITSIETAKAYFSSETLENLRSDEAMKLVEDSFKSIETKIIIFLLTIFKTYFIYFFIVRVNYNTFNFFFIFYIKNLLKPIFNNFFTFILNFRYDFHLIIILYSLNSFIHYSPVYPLVA